MIEFSGYVEQHIHGAFGIDFMRAGVKEILECAEKLLQTGCSVFFPTVMTDDLSIIKDRIAVIKEAKLKQKDNQAYIAGIHLEGPFINPEKAGIHEKRFIQPLLKDIYTRLDDHIIKIVTLAPELDNSGEFLKYLALRGIKISAGHSLATDLSKVNQVTHLYNAMGAFSHRGNSTAVSALVNDNVYAEIIGDSVHVSDDVLKITFRQKPAGKILLISDALPLAHSELENVKFAGQLIFNMNGRAVNDDGVLAGSSLLLCDIVKNVVNKSITDINRAILASSVNQINYHGLKSAKKVFLDDELNFVKYETIN